MIMLGDTNSNPLARWLVNSVLCLLLTLSGKDYTKLRTRGRFALYFCQHWSSSPLLVSSSSLYLCWFWLFSSSSSSTQLLISSNFDHTFRFFLFFHFDSVNQFKFFFALFFLVKNIKKMFVSRRGRTESLNFETCGNLTKLRHSQTGLGVRWIFFVKTFAFFAWNK